VIALLQFDSASVALLERLIDEGRLPVLEDLRARGRWLPLAAPDADIAAAVYHTVYSGVEAGDHGLYHTFQWRPEQQRSRFMESQPKPETIWERVTKAGGRALVVDPFVNWPPGRMNGVCVSGWQFKNRIIMQRWGEPAGVLGPLERRFGRAPLLEETLGPTTPSRLLSLTRHLRAGPARAALMAVDVLERESFDFVWITLSPAHFAGHWLWDAAGLFPGRIDAAQQRELDGTLAEVYQAVDEAIGQIVEALPADADLIVLSPTGIAENVSKSDLLPAMIKAILAGRPALNGKNASALWSMRSVLPPAARSAFSRAMPSAVNRAIVSRLYFQGVDWSQTRAFAIPGETTGLVRLNLRGREREGIVAPEEAGELLDTLSAGLRSFVDQDGAPAVASVERAQERWPGGARVDQLPDLVVHWASRPSKAVSSVSAPGLGTLARPGVGTGWPGNHCDEAWALLLPATRRLRAPTGEPRLVDLAATVAGVTGADASGLVGSSPRDIAPRRGQAGPSRQADRSGESSSPRSTPRYRLRRTRPSWPRTSGGSSRARPA
jgi:predicted AlkP superfamily phosphohydrolase/phosphomutase